MNMIRRKEDILLMSIALCLRVMYHLQSHRLKAGRIGFNLGVWAALKTAAYSSTFPIFNTTRGKNLRLTFSLRMAIIFYAPECSGSKGISRTPCSLSTSCKYHCSRPFLMRLPLQTRSRVKIAGAFTNDLLSNPQKAIFKQSSNCVSTGIPHLYAGTEIVRPPALNTCAWFSLSAAKAQALELMRLLRGLQYSAAISWKYMRTSVKDSVTRSTGNDMQLRKVHEWLLAGFMSALLMGCASGRRLDANDEQANLRNNGAMKQPDIVRREGFLVMGTVTHRKPGTDRPEVFEAIWNDFETLQQSIKHHTKKLQ
jgi:hypothetical protein